MKFPNKVTPFNQSVLSKFVPIIQILQEKDYTVYTLYNSLKVKMTVNEYIDALDCLYALGVVTLNKGVLHYVNRNSIWCF